MVNPAKDNTEGPFDVVDFCDAELDSALRELIEGLISQLDRRYAEVIFRSEILEHTPTLIAQEMGLSVRTVTSILKLGRQQLIRLVLSTLRPVAEE